MSPAMTNALATVLSSIDKKFGKGTVMRLTDAPLANPADVIPSGSIGLDAALGIGGYRKGRIVEIYGPESSGKTTLTLHAVAECQKHGGVAAFIDAEHGLDPSYAKALGVKVEDLLISQPDYGEAALETVDMLAKSGEVNLIVVDSVAALVPQKELEGEMGDQHVGLQARMMSQAMRKITGTVHQTGCVVIFVNQIRMKIGVMFGNPETTTGGNALKFYASQRLDIRRTNAIKAGEKIIGNRTKVKVVKNKLAPPFRETEFDIRFGIGIDQLSEICDLAVEDELIEKSGAWYSYNGERLGQGKENAIQFLREHDDICQAIRANLVELRGLSANPVLDPTGADDLGEEGLGNSED